jgi:small conductance mechanosensitive channel
VVEELALSVVRKLDFLNSLKPVELNFTRFSEKSIDFEILFWINQDKIGPGPAKSLAMKAVKKIFDENNIAFPTPAKAIEPVGNTSDKQQGQSVPVS